MSYLTHADLLQSPGATELAQAAADDDAIVGADLMAATLAGADRSVWTAKAIAAADAALARIDRLLADVGELIDGHLGARYTLPLDPVPGIVRGWATDILRYRLHDDLAADSHIAARYRDALRLLDLVRNGKLALGASPQQASPGLGPAASTRERVMTRDTLSAY